MNDLPLCEILRALRKLLEPFVNRCLCDFDSFFELFAIRLYHSGLVLTLPCWVKNLGIRRVFGCHNCCGNYRQCLCSIYQNADTMQKWSNAASRLALPLPHGNGCHE